MTILKSPQDTFVARLRSQSAERAARACYDAQQSEGLLTKNYYEYLNLPSEIGESTTGVYTGALVTHGSASEARIPPFVLPMLVEDEVAAASKQVPRHFLVADARPFMQASRNASEPCRVVNKMEFELMRVHLAACAFWLSQGPAKLLSLSPVMGEVYCRWMANTIGRSRELDGPQRLTTRVLAAYFFQCNFNTNQTPNETQKAAMVALACRAAGVPHESFAHIFKDVDMIESAEDFVGHLKRVLDTPRMDTYNSGILSASIQGTWFGFNGKDLALAAVEHPPTFAAMLYMAFVQNGYRKAPLAQYAEDFKGNKGGAQFMRDMQLQLGLQPN